MSEHQIEKSQIEAEIATAEIALSDLGRRHRELWEQVRIEPQKWAQNQYPELDSFWVVGLLAQRCLYLNAVENGWGWGCFNTWGQISEFHWENFEINHVIAQLLLTIDQGQVTLDARIE